MYADREENIREGNMLMHRIKKIITSLKKRHKL